MAISKVVIWPCSVFNFVIPKVRITKHFIKNEKYSQSYLSSLINSRLVPHPESKCGNNDSLILYFLEIQKLALFRSKRFTLTFKKFFFCLIGLLSVVENELQIRRTLPNAYLLDINVWRIFYFRMKLMWVRFVKTILLRVRWTACPNNKSFEITIKEIYFWGCYFYLLWYLTN